MNADLNTGLYTQDYQILVNENLLRMSTQKKLDYTMTLRISFHPELKLWAVLDFDKILSAFQTKEEAIAFCQGIEYSINYP